MRRLWIGLLNNQLQSGRCGEAEMMILISDTTPCDSPIRRFSVSPLHVLAGFDQLLIES